MAVKNPYLEDHYILNGNGNFKTISEYERAIENGDIDEDGYDSEGNQYDSKGDLYD